MLKPLPDRRLLVPVGRRPWRMACVACLAVVLGCTSQVQRPTATRTDRPIAAPDSLQLVRDLARPWGMKWIEVEGVSLAVGLAGTGSDPAPTAERAMMMSEMQVRDVHNPDRVLASSDTALAMVRALLPPGVQKGDRLDVEVRVPARSKTKSLQGGWSMLARLREYALLNQRLSSGHVMAMCQGDILVDSLVEGDDDPILKTRGRILGGAVATESRDLGLRLRDEHLSVRSSARIGEAINQRFHVYLNGDKQGVANPKRDSFIQLAVHPRYRQNIIRYMRVIENIPVRESGPELVDRLKALQPRLLNPPTSSESAVQLEAIGLDAVPVLKEGLDTSNPEVRFYCAEALAYLDEPEAAQVLGDSIRAEPAFRWRGFRALEAMEDAAAHDQLGLLLHEDSAETRYEAFRTLRRLQPSDPLIQGQLVGEQFHLHVVDSAAPTLVHVAKSERPEIVIFGSQVPLQHPVVILAGPQIVIRSTDDDRIRVRRLTSDDSDEQRVVDSELQAVVQAVVELGGKYTDVVQAIVEARRFGCLECRVEFSATPEPGRKYRRQADGEDETSDEEHETSDNELAPVVDAQDLAAGRPKPVRTDDLSGLLLFEDDSAPDGLPAPAVVIDQIGP